MQGENGGRAWGKDWMHGPSPHAGGEPAHQQREHQHRRTIPPCRGRTLCANWHCGRATDHPPMQGENRPGWRGRGSRSGLHRRIIDLEPSVLKIQRGPPILSGSKRLKRWTFEDGHGLFPPNVADTPRTMPLSDWGTEGDRTVVEPFRVHPFR